MLFHTTLGDPIAVGGSAVLLLAAALAACAVPAWRAAHVAPIEGLEDG